MGQTRFMDGVQIPPGTPVVVLSETVAQKIVDKFDVYLQAQQETNRQLAIMTTQLTEREKRCAEHARVESSLLKRVGGLETGFAKVQGGIKAYVLIGGGGLMAGVTIGVTMAKVLTG